MPSTNGFTFTSRFRGAIVKNTMVFGCIITLIFAPISFGLNTGFSDCFTTKNNHFCRGFALQKTQVIKLLQL